jgi:preprotein translocase subunit Sss1
MQNKLLQIETHVGEPISVGDTDIIPMAQSTTLRPPGAQAGLIWNRPASLVARTPYSQEYILPVNDVTRQAQVALLAIGLIGSFIIWLIYRKSPS